MKDKYEVLFTENKEKIKKINTPQKKIDELGVNKSKEKSS